jgi:hypothetical protein
MRARQNGDRAWLSIWPEGDNEGRIREVPKKTDFQVCTLLNIYVFVHNEISALLLHGLSVTNKCCLFAMCECVCTITDVYFHRLKINHESHEFILDPGTVVNK